MDYWEECISEAFDDAGISATKEQIDAVASWVAGAHENYGTAMGYDAIPNPLALENERLERELRKEKDKVICEYCGGKGWTSTSGPYHSSMSQCPKCHGEGRHSL